jgi:NAD(P)-dependent dehydrogenase (short-subunit alcohol dehydrogenase family)
MKNNNKIAVVTGICGGIGSAVAEALYDDGYTVAGFDIKDDEKEGHSKYKKYKIDVSSLEQVRGGMLEVFKEYGKINCLINCAGILSVKDFYNDDYEDWKKVLRVNLDSVYICSKEALKYLVENQISHIINISSVSALKQSVFSSVAYCASKAAILGMSRTMAAQLAHDGVRVNCIAPGFVNTDLINIVDPEIRENCENSVPLGRMADSAEIAGSVKYLLSDAAKFITGETVNINGGTYMP